MYNTILRRLITRYRFNQFNYKVSSNMFRPLMCPSSGRYKQEHIYKNVITIPPLKILLVSVLYSFDYLMEYGPHKTQNKSLTVSCKMNLQKTCSLNAKPWKWRSVYYF